MQLNTNDIELSVVVAIVSDTISKCCDLSHLTGCLNSLKAQVDPPLMEIIVPHPVLIDGLNELKESFPNVDFLAVSDLKSYTGKGGSREHHDELRARGIAAGCGRIIALLEDHARPDIHWCRNIVDAHNQDYAAIGGAIENDIDRPINWAVYFCDFGKYQNPVVEGESSFVSDANVSYKRESLQNIVKIWQTAFREPEVNWSIIQGGEKIALSSGVIVYQYRDGLTIKSALKERYIWGRSYAVTRSELMPGSKRYLYALYTPLLPVILGARLVVTVYKKKRNMWAFIKSSPLIMLLLLFWSAGEFSGYISLQSV